MATVSPSFTFAGVSTPLAKKSVAASSSVSATLDSIAGVNSVAWSIVSTDESTSSASYTLVTSGAKGETVTFTSLAAGTGGLLKCTVNGGVDPQTGNPSTAMSATAKFFVPTAGGGEVGVTGETTESHATHGSTGIINFAVRNVAGSAVTSVGAAAPITSTGGTTPTIGISPASAIAAGSQSAAHYSDLADATSAATANKIFKRGASAEGYVAFTGTGAANSSSTGWARFPVTAATLVAARNAANDADIAVLAVDGADGVVVGASGAALATLSAGAKTATLTSASFTGNVPFVANYYALTLTNIATVGVLRTTSSSQTIIAARNAANNADISLLSINGSDAISMGGSGATSFTVTTGTHSIVSNTSEIVATSTSFRTNDGSTDRFLVDGSNTRIDLGYSTIRFTDNLTAIAISHLIRAGNGANNGLDLTVEAQQGQAQTGGAANNNGGALRLKGGPAGTGGGGAAGVRGSVVLSGGSKTATLDSTSLTIDAPVVASYYALTLTNIATVGALRTTSASQAIVAARNAANSADVSVISIDGSNGIDLGDATDGAAIRALTPTAFKVYDGSTDRLVVDISNTRVDLGYSSLRFADTLTAPAVSHVIRAGTGANNGLDTTIEAQQGQAQGGGSDNNNGGALRLKGGPAGTGGGGAAGVRGSVVLSGGSKTLTIDSSGATCDGPVIASSTTTLDDNELTYGGSAGATTLSQAQRSGTGANAGSTLTLRAQQGQQQSGGAANNNGGSLVLAAGSPGTGGGGAAGVQGTVQLQGSSVTADCETIDWTLAVSETGGPSPTSVAIKPRVTIGKTTDATPTVVWSYTVTASAVVTIHLSFMAKTSDVEIFQERILRMNNTGTPELYEEVVGTDRNTIAGGSSVAYARNGNAIEVTFTGVAATTINILTDAWRITEIVF